MSFRNNGGYSLPLVLIIISILALIATTLMTVSINNMTSQRDEIERMQKQYEAQGKLEMVLSELSDNQIVELTNTSNQAGAVLQAISLICDSYDVDVSAQSENTLKLWQINSQGKITPYTSNVEPYETLFTYDFLITANSGDDTPGSGDVTVAYALQLAGRIAYNDLNDSANTRLYIITSPEIITKSVDVGGVV